MQVETSFGRSLYISILLTGQTLTQAPQEAQYPALIIPLDKVAKFVRLTFLDDLLEDILKEIYHRKIKCFGKID